jgi:hypothetical protein
MWVRAEQRAVNLNERAPDHDSTLKISTYEAFAMLRRRRREGFVGISIVTESFKQQA